MKIRLGTLRKIIKEELKKARMQEIGNIGVVAPAGKHGASALTGWNAPSLKKLHDEIENAEDILPDVIGNAKDITTNELISMFAEMGMELTNVPPRAMGITYSLYKNNSGEVKLIGKDVLGNDVFEVKKGSGPLQYSVESLEITPEAMAGRALAASTK